MTRFIVPFLALSALATLVAAAPSTTTASIFEDLVEAIEPPGRVEGVGSDGTTYVLSAALTLDEGNDLSTVVPITMTLVEDATHVSEFASVQITPPASLTSLLEGSVAPFSLIAECGVASGRAICTEQVLQGSRTVLMDTRTIGPTAIPVVSAAATNSKVSSYLGLVILGLVLVISF